MLPIEKVVKVNDFALGLAPVVKVVTVAAEVTWETEFGELIAFVPDVTALVVVLGVQLVVTDGGEEPSSLNH